MYEFTCHTQCDFPQVFTFDSSSKGPQETITDSSTLPKPSTLDVPQKPLPHKSKDTVLPYHHYCHMTCQPYLLYTKSVSAHLDACSMGNSISNTRQTQHHVSPASQPAPVSQMVLWHMLKAASSSNIRAARGALSICPTSIKDT